MCVCVCMATNGGGGGLREEDGLGGPGAAEAMTLYGKNTLSRATYK